MSINTLEIKNLHATIEGKEILKGVNLTVKKGEIHALMGPNGSGKSTLAYAVIGHPKYEITEGEVLVNGENILEYGADERAKKGLFLAFQYPIAIPGVSVANFLRSAVSAVRLHGNGKKPEEVNTPAQQEANLIPMREFRKELNDAMKAMGVDKGFARRYVNDGFSGGEKKRMEILQLSMLKPKFAILDETDSGLDIDALRVVSNGVNRAMESHELGVLIITHYQRILNYIKPHHVHVFMDGRIIESGGPQLALELEEKGYEFIRQKYGLEVALSEEDKIGFKGMATQEIEI